MIKVCSICGAEYEDHATYCNVCKQDSLVPVIERVVKKQSQRLVEDGPTLAYVTAAWLLGLGYMIGQLRPRTWTTLVLGWAFLTLLTTVFCIVMRNVRMAAIMSLFGLCFFVIYGVLIL